MTVILAFIIGAAIPSVLLWFKTREAQGLLDELLRKEGRRPLQRKNVFRGKDRKAQPDDGSDNQNEPPVVQTIKPSPIDKMMQEAIVKDSKEFGQTSPDKEPLLR
jgi:hypothetical protein